MAYCGPGNCVPNYSVNNGIPINETDALCYKHDLAYDAATNPQDIRKADLELLSGLDKLPHSQYGNRATYNAIKLKTGFENTIPLVAESILKKRFGR